MKRKYVSLLSSKAKKCTKTKENQDEESLRKKTKEGQEVIVSTPPDELKARTFSQIITGSILQSPRDLYLSLIQQPSPKQKFIDLAKKAISFIPQTPSKVDQKYVPLLYDGKESYSLDGIKIIGRKTGLCDFVLSTNLSFSRLHAIIIPLQDRIYLVDMGSLLGTHVTYTNEVGDGVEEHIGCFSKKYSLNFHNTACVKLVCGPSQLLINPKKCVICMNSYRNTVFSCGHFVACEQCISKIDNCPICRNGISLDNLELRNASFIRI